jgi:hypothetical protein
MRYFTLFLFALPFLLNAQPLNTSVTDCNNVTKSIQTTLSSGKALIIAHKGVDCTICQGQAPSLQTWAAANKAKVEVWCALTWKYNPNTFNPACSATNSWVNTYNWTDIYTFPDYNRDCLSSGTPRYYVYSPMDCTIVFSGGKSQAEARALQETLVGIEESSLIKSVKISTFKGAVSLSGLSPTFQEVRLYNVTGTLQQINLIKAEKLKIQNLKSGIYILQFIGQTSVIGSKKIFIP